LKPEPTGADVVNVRLQTSSRSARRQPPALQVRQLGDVAGEARGHPYVSFAPDQINAMYGAALSVAHWIARTAKLTTAAKNTSIVSSF
jgi:hypothetical protein